MHRSEVEKRLMDSYQRKKRSENHPESAIISCTYTSLLRILLLAINVCNEYSSGYLIYNWTYVEEIFALQLKRSRGSARG